MNKDDSCTLTKIRQFIKTNKERGMKNPEIIKQLTKKGCYFQTIFDAMDKETKTTKV